METGDFVSTAQELVAKGKGILAADESYGTIKKRLATIGVDSTETARRSYRNLLFTTSEMERYISGVILFDETIRQTSEDGTPFPKLLAEKGVVPGIKVDKGTVPLAGFRGEKVTEGLDGLRERLEEYRSLGARFTKWRGVFSITSSTPAVGCIAANAHALARFAALSQEAGLTPIVEPEVLMDGDHQISRCEAVTTTVLRHVFVELAAQHVLLEGMLLKPNMVLPGEDFSQRVSPAEVAEATLRCLKRVVPASVPGIVFLSGGQSPEQASGNLNAINLLDGPWELSFSFGRALQEQALRAWKGDEANVAVAQERFHHRAKLNGAAREGRYSPEME